MRGHGHGLDAADTARHGGPSDPSAAAASTGRRAAFGPFGPGGSRRPGGPFGPGFGHGAPGAAGTRRPRGRARRGDVRASILALLKDRPMHGYEMIQEIAERSGGRGSPAPARCTPPSSCWRTRG